MRFSARHIPMKLIYLLIALLLVIFLLYYTSGGRFDCTLQKSANSKHQNNYSECEVIHIGIVCIGYESNFYLYTMLKSLYFHRNNPLHFHIVVDDISEKILKNMFDRWAVPQVALNFYNVNTFPSYSWLTKGNMKVMFPKLISTTTPRKIIILDTYLTFTGDIYELWTLFDYFNGKQAIGLVENQSNEYSKKIGSESAIIGQGFNTDVILFHLEVLKTKRWDQLLDRAVNDIIPLFEDPELTDQNIINALVSENIDLLDVISCHWNTQILTDAYNCYNRNQIKIVNWNSTNNFLSTTNNGDYLRILHRTFHEYNGTSLRMQLRDCGPFSKNDVKHTITDARNDTCEDFREAYFYKWRTLLFFREFKHNPSGDDVTLASHLTYDRLHVLETLSERWEGPMSLVLFVTDSELSKCMSFIENSKLLQNRFNIAYHAVFKELNYHHPINTCRNIALRNVVTPFVFLNDIDFVPMQDLYGSLKKYVDNIGGMEKKVLVIPAFDTNPKFRENIPATKPELLKMMDNKRVLQFMKRYFPGGHAPTNYTRWRIAKQPYTVKWQFKYEPYVVVGRNITGYDERFVGYSWNKVSYFTKLKAQGYDYVVLPNAFVVHKRHRAARGKFQLLKSARYRNCLRNLMKDVIKELNKEYGFELDFQ